MWRDEEKFIPLRAFFLLENVDAATSGALWDTAPLSGTHVCARVNQNDRRHRRARETDNAREETVLRDSQPEARLQFA